jgi:hypothetical protein
MRRRIITTLGVLAAITGLSSSVLARPAVPTSETREFSLTRNSIVGIESRTIGDDYRKFFGIENPTTISLNTTGEGNIFPDGDDGVWRISEDTRLLVNEPLVRPVGIVPFNRDENGVSLFGDVERIEVQTELN